MKVVILAGGYGTRLGAISDLIPKPMVKIGNKPIIWHIMKYYSVYGYKNFVICLGYKSEAIKDYFRNYYLYNNDFTINLFNDKIIIHDIKTENWEVTLVNTGEHALKGARLKRVEDYLTDNTNLMTYGDGVANIDINELIKFHKTHKKILTISGVYPPSRFGEIIHDKGKIISFREKPQTSSGLINGGYMVFEKEIFKYLSDNDQCDLETAVFEALLNDNQIAVYEHKGQWECIDTERDLGHLNMLWNNKNPFWKNWA